MPLFDLRNARKKLSSSSLTLRKTQSTGDIDDPVDNIKPSISSPTTDSSSCAPPVQRYNNSAIPPTGILLNKRPLTPPPSSSNSTSIIPSSSILTPVIEQTDDDRSIAVTATKDENDRLAAKLKDITACDMDLLLALETQARMDIQEEKKSQRPQPPPRTSRLTFDIPATPPRSRSPDSNKHSSTTSTTTGRDSLLLEDRRWSLPVIGREFSLPQSTVSFFSKRKSANQDAQPTVNSKRLSCWSRVLSRQMSEEEATEDSASVHADPPLVTQPSTILIGSKVKLIKRPLPIIGTVKYIGKVHFDQSQEDWLGIELDSRVGNTDGKMDDIRYFQTNPNCGIFVRKEDTVKV
ncbi:MAG: hypothetical protein EXX96DRAFT_617759 [Benjaminiella poitrasii]|nr:MAG: hypothetical protein EXX96DRAFT_617759 [Benjaminiella poitrasii]